VDKRCARCGVALEAGSLRARAAQVSWDLVELFSFVRPGTATSWNPIEAIRQGMAGEPTDETLPVSVWSCPQCGLLELYATKE
jgi:hypothetical protein